MKRVPSSLLALAVVVALTTVPAIAQEPPDSRANDVLVGLSKRLAPEVLTALDAELYDYHVFELDVREINRRVRGNGRLSLHLGNKTFDLELEENNLRGESYRRVALSQDGARDLAPGPITTFRGTVMGDPESVVRLSVTPTLFSGFIYTGGEMLFIDPVADFARNLLLPKAKAPATGDLVVYLEKNQRGNQAGECGTSEFHGLKRIEHMMPELDIQHFITKDGGGRTLEVALECDGQYHAAFGLNGGIDRMEGIVNNVEGVIYVSELDLGINIVFSGCWQSIPNDPYTSLSASTTLNQMANWWAANGDNFAPTRDLTHQFSGKDFTGGTIGIAFVGVICTNRNLSVGISQDIAGSAARRRLTAHEIGHNLSANHDTGVNCSGNGPIMCPNIQTGGSSAADDFSNTSLNSICNHIDNFGSCI